jgi:hypothetical protein
MRPVHHRSFILAVRLFIPALAVTVIAVTVLSLGRCGERSTADRRLVGSTVPTSLTVDHRTLVRALETTRAIESGRVEVAFVLTRLGHAPDLAPGGRLPVATYRVAFDRRAGRVDVEADMSGAAGVVGMRAADGGADFTVPARLVAVDDVVYARGGPMAATIGRAPTDWVRLDRASLVDRGPQGDAVSLLFDPFGPLQVLGEATAGARVVGHDEIRGSPATHLATHAGRRGRAAPVDVWVDADGVIRRLEIRLSGGVGADDGALVTTVDLFDVGHPVDVTAPAER